MELGPFVVILIGVLIITFVLSTRNKNKQKVDKGFKANYYRLSYRRKMIRTLWLLPTLPIIYLMVVYVLEYGMGAAITLTAAAAILWTVQLAYNYLQYKKEEQERNINS
ncbi:ATPase [Alteribacter lacisalsi]|uniref:ATPase n=1 Tax=Alteribacter lacisalsi TaxID=2045244 RepID=A0A2W0HIW9_9BACI|nr:ATPase [Alteribacter lacisalsi]PYZ96739.1 ATPase [Alteribacter lacisalsi]